LEREAGLGRRRQARLLLDETAQIVGQVRAIFGEHLADPRADASGHLMEWRLPQHEMGTGDADLSAVLHQAYVLAGSA